jgi:hypothetical protein
MGQTRRQFVMGATALSVLAAGGGMLARATGGGPVRQSLGAFSADPARVASLRKGVAAMKALSATDKRSWFFWAATHAYSDALFDVEVKRDLELKTFDAGRYWNKCPHFGQCSADFVIWHRAYLHFFERALRAASCDATLALPYWDYGSEAGRGFPLIYANEFLDPAETQSNPLYHPNREQSFARGLVEISAAIGEAPKTVAAATFFHQIGQPGFAGDTLDGDHTQIGLLEQRPHNDIHLAVGGVIDSANGAMAEITTAAFDPVFWVHHANIDRLWAAWASAPGKDWGPLPSSDWFDERPWLFADENGNDVLISRGEAIAMLATYDVDYSNQLALAPVPVKAEAPRGGAASADAPMPSVGAAPQAHRAIPHRPIERELLADANPLTVSPHRAGRRRLSPTTTLQAPAFAEGARVLLELADIAFTLVPSSGFAVYLDPEAAAPATEPIGLIDIFGATHHAMAGMTMPAAQRFDVTQVLRRSRGPFTLRVEPYSLLVTRDQQPARARADAVTIGKVRFVVLD